MANQSHPRIERAIKAMRQLGVTHPALLVAFAKFKPRLTVDDSIPTAAVDASGRIYLGTTCDTIELPKLAARIYHEMTHPMWAHFNRMGGRDPKVWNIAADMLINQPWHDAGLPHPETWLLLPREYTGERTAEALYAWLQEEQKAGKDHGQGNATGEDGNGCGMSPSKSDDAGDTASAEPFDAGEAAAQFVAASQVMGNGVGKGTAAFAAVFQSKPATQSWKRLLRFAAQRCSAGAVRDVRSYARLTRRPIAGLTRPGMLSETVKLAIVVDVSGSVERTWLAQVAAECAKVLAELRNVEIFLVAHTDEVVWSGWIKRGQETKIDAALSFTGGTDPVPAYELVAKTAQFTGMLHFTDCEFYTWPNPPKRCKLIVGALGNRGYGCKPPAGAQIIKVAA